MLPAVFFKMPTIRCARYILFGAIFLLAGCQLPFMGKKAATEKPALPPCVVLALPETGNFSSITKKIARGADTALKSLRETGIEAQLRFVNTEAPNWLAQLEQLPAECAVVGGPIQDKKYIEARQAGILERRVFFAFTPNLVAGDEGKLAWRFFPSPEDQADALIKFATDELNIRSFGAMYPDDDYGRKMLEIFEKAVSRKHMSLEKAAYNPSNPGSIATAAESLIRPQTAEDGKTMLPQTTFEALFLPDSWKRADALRNSLVYNGEERLVLLGPMLWEQALAGKKVPAPEKFALAVFPAAWNSESLPAALKKANPDFWVALGYDFVNFAVNSGMAARLDSSAVTAAAQKSATVLRAVAPMSWSANGVGSQSLYLFQIGPAGMMPLDRDRFAQNRLHVNEKAALRMQGLLIEPTAETATPTPTPDPIPAVLEEKPPLAKPGSPALSTVPIPSYKLRLPTPQ